MRILTLDLTLKVMIVFAILIYPRTLIIVYTCRFEKKKLQLNLANINCMILKQRIGELLFVWKEIRSDFQEDKRK